MWHTWNGGAYGWGLGMIGMALFWVVVIAAIVVAVRAVRDRGRYAGPAPRETPLQILQRRYASGEIDKREFDEKKRDLS